MAAGLSCAPGCKVVHFLFPAEQIELASQGTERNQAPAPMDSASTRGLEVRLWVVDDTDWTAARMLLGYVQSDQSSVIEPVLNPDTNPIAKPELLVDPISMQDLARWSDWGFRLITIPVGEVQGFLDTLDPVQPTNVQWLGEFAGWRPIVRAGELQTSHVRVGDHINEIEPGRPSLIARSWIEPVLTESDVVPAVRVDLGMQIEQDDAKREVKQSIGAMDISRERLIEDNGPIIDELLLSLFLDGSKALVLVGEASDADWSMIPDPVDLQIKPTTVDSETDQEEDQRNEGRFGPGAFDDGEDQLVEPAIGSQDVNPSSSSRTRDSGSEPKRPSGKTLGELMLTSPGSRIVRANESRTVPVRVVVVLIPRVEGGFGLIPKRATALPDS